MLAHVAAPIADTFVLSFPAGEVHKTRETWARLTDQLIAQRFGRDTMIIAMGGGVTTDLGGFVAATYLRGVPWIAMPTSTLGMIDAAIGGKTGVDTAAGKNLVGAFHPPCAVIADISTLNTLPEANFIEGIAEAVKHAAILDAAYGDWLSAHADAVLRRELPALETLVHRSAELKAMVVSGDEIEGGRRAILNAGHTVGHALELATGYAIPHGHAVAVGLVAETRMAEAAGWCDLGTSTRIIALLRTFGLPSELPSGTSLTALHAFAGTDKKAVRGETRMSVVRRFGVVEPFDSTWTRPTPNSMWV